MGHAQSYHQVLSGLPLAGDITAFSSPQSLPAPARWVQEDGAPHLAFNVAPDQTVDAMVMSIDFNAAPRPLAVAMVAHPVIAVPAGDAVDEGAYVVGQWLPLANGKTRVAYVMAPPGHNPDAFLGRAVGRALQAGDIFTVAVMAKPPETTIQQVGADAFIVPGSSIPAPTFPIPSVTPGHFRVQLQANVPGNIPRMSPGSLYRIKGTGYVSGLVFSGGSSDGTLVSTSATGAIVFNEGADVKDHGVPVGTVDGLSLSADGANHVGESGVQDVFVTIDIYTTGDRTQIDGGSIAFSLVLEPVQP